MRRRDFITLLGGAAAALPAQAQQPVPLIGWVSGGTSGSDAPLLAPFRQALNAQGYVEGRNVAFEYRWAEGQIDRLQALAGDLVRLRPSVIVAAGAMQSVIAAKALTTTIPIVFQMAGDPVALGLVDSLNRPGGNVTGVTSLNAEIGSKRFELLHEMVPAATIIALLVNPTSPGVEAYSRDAKAAARRLGLELDVLNASSERDFDAVFARLPQLRAGALEIMADGLFNILRAELATLTLRHGVPAITQSREFPAAGGLMSYGADIADQYRQIGVYTGRILKGDKPSDLPVQQAAKFKFVINLKTAKALGLTVPATLLVAADEVIE
jgi:putative ABC transport system substrate-binding protein